MCTPSLGARCRVFIFWLLLCLVTFLLPVVYILYKTDSLFSASAVRRRRGRVVGLHNPCFGRMAVERCLRYFVIRACSRDVWENFSLGTSLNKQCLSAYNKWQDGGSLNISSYIFRYLCVEMSRVSVVGVVVQNEPWTRVWWIFRILLCF